MSDQNASANGVDLKDPVVAGVLAWLIPGLGHAYQGRLGKSALYAICIFGLFFQGMRQSEGSAVYFKWDDKEWRVSYLAQFWMGISALPALLKSEWRSVLPERWRDFEAVPSDRRLDDLNRQYGKRLDTAVIYTMVAGLLNVLAILDAVFGPAQRPPTHAPPGTEPPKSPATSSEEKKT